MNFPKINDVDVAFGGYPKEFFQKCLTKKVNTKYAGIAQTLFFEGGTVPVNESLPKEERIKGLRLLRAILGSFDPKHEHKIHVCGIILEELCEVKN